MSGIAYPAYKTTGIEWLGRIPAEWSLSRVKFDSYVKARVGWHGLKSDEFTDEGAYLITGTDFSEAGIDWSNCKHCTLERYRQDPYIQLEDDDLLLTKDGTIGKVTRVGKLPDVACLNSGIFVVRPLSDKYLTDFFFWVLCSSVFDGFIDYNKTGSTISHLYQETFNQFAYSLPTLTEQRAIASFLDRETGKIDELIAKQERMIELLKEKRQAVISHAVTKGLEPNAPMKDSGIEWLGEIPEHWVVSSLKHLYTNLDYKRIPLSAEERGSRQGEYSYYGASGVIDSVDDYLFAETAVLVGEDGANLVTRSTPLAFVASGKYWVNNHAHILRFKDNRPVYWAYVIDNLDITSFVSGSAQPKLTAEALGNLIVAYPKGIAERQAIAEHVEIESAKINNLIAKAEQAIELMKERRTALISAAVTGKIDVRGDA